MTNSHAAIKEEGMSHNEALLRVVYENAGDESRIPLSDLATAITGFLDHFAEKSLVGETFFNIVQTGDGAAKFSRLLDACDCSDNPEKFFSQLLHLYCSSFPRSVLSKA